MRRQEKYPDTNTFKFYNANPRGRLAADCSFRAIATALEQDYNQTVMEMAEMMCQTGYAMNESKGEEAYLKSKGWVKCKQPRKPDNTKYTGEEFCTRLAGKDKVYIANIGGNHIVCIKDQKIWDTWNCSKKSIGNYYVKDSGAE